MDEKNKIIEFNNNVWNHSEDKFQQNFDERRNLRQEEYVFLNEINLMISNHESDEDILNFLRENFVSRNFETLELLLQIIGMTRNKIVSDLKGIVGAKKAEYKLSNHKSIVNDDKSWKIAGPYLLKKIKQVFYTNHEVDQIYRVYEALNQATWPGWIRQERAKRSGHEAEYRIAILLARLKIPFVPLEKAENPLCKDSQINDISFDIVVPNLSNPKICVKATVHTANIGQYGESKDHLEVDEAKRMVDKSYHESDRPIIFAFIDGIGMQSNMAGLKGVLEKSDEFCQFKTIWKLITAAIFYTNKKCELYLTDESINHHREFLERYKACLILKNKSNSNSTNGGLEVGEAIIKLI